MLWIKKICCIQLLISSLFIVSCATESHQSLEVKSTQSAITAYQYSGPKSAIFVGKFDNRSGYMQGLFTEGPDKLASQAKTSLISHLQQTGRFSVLDRDNLKEIENETKISGKAQKLKGADFAIVGDITEFGRKEVGDKQFFGIFGSGKSQIAYAKVTLNVVDVATSEVVYSVSGAGEYKLSDREVLGFGSTATYDSTLNGKVIDLSMREAIDRLVSGLQDKRWTVSK